MTKVICSARETCEEADICGGAKPHTQVKGCSKCGMHDQECEPVEESGPYKWESVMDGRPRTNH